MATATGSNPGTNSASSSGLEASSVAALCADSSSASDQSIAQAMGVPVSQVSTLRTRFCNQQLSPQQMEALTRRLGAMNVSPGQVNAIGKALGLSSEQLSRIQQSIAPTAASAGTANNQPTSGASAPPATAESAAAPPSLIESKFRQLDSPFEEASAPTAANLTQFGYGAFASPASAFAPMENVPVSDNYVLGPGDHLTVYMWGRINNQLNLEVQPDGSAMIDQVGPVQVAGLTFGQARKLIQGRLQQAVGVQAEVAMGQLRTIQVTVVGAVNHPGTYTVSGLSHLSNALVAAGGISKIGSLRRVEVRREDKLFRTADLYDLLVNGDNSEDIQLKQGDVIFVPLIGQVVAVEGDVKRPAIYELSSNDQYLGQVIDQLAGGLTAFGYSEHVQIERAQNHKRVVVLDISAVHLAHSHFKLHDGDLVKVFSILPRHTNTVLICGNVYRPGEYQWHRGMRVADLVKDGQGLMPHTFLRYALIERMEGPQKYTHFVQVDLDAALSGRRSANLLLSRHDRLQIYNFDQLRDLPLVTITGAVRQPGRYLLNQQMRVSDLIYLAGGLSDEAYERHASLVRLSVRDGHAVRHAYDLDLADILKGGSPDDMVLKTGDDLTIYSVIGWNQPERQVIVNGDVVDPGSYAFTQGMTLRDLLADAGGFQDNADRQRVQLARTEVVGGSKTRRTLTTLDLRQGSPDLNYPLDFDDQVYVTTAQDWHLPWVVTVKGEVARPGKYVISRNERLMTVLKRAGGFLPDAYPGAIVFERAAVRDLEQEQLDQARQRISQQLTQVSLNLPLLSATAGGSQHNSQIAATYSQLQQLLASSQGVQATGRILVHMNQILNGNQQDNLVLDNGDSITIPKRPSSVAVLGQVYHPTAVSAARQMTVRDYLYAAGGPTQQGDLKRVMIIKADGSVITEDGLKNSRKASLFPLLPVFSGGIMAQTLQPGDTIYVPENLDNLQSAIRLSYWKDITTIVAQSASSLGVIALLATKL